ncbi:putative WD repeat domain 74 [Lyophyllum shimeji]|uniref:Ribosome biogenesis protein NSA1 n=1 Tax=Lyophyllum shimeji TaxID=47721 RepID=A0A9P3PFN4_LYOSH|nr:putative WD repeat domain 74 [Lyophyllum shimeji]
MPRFFAGDELGNIKIAIAKLTAGLSDGTASTFFLRDSDALEVTHQWKETRLRNEHRYVGLETFEKGTFTCTSNGALRFTRLNVPDPAEPLLGALPTRLHAWEMSPNQSTFAYGGDEVDVSVWDTERAFLPRPQTTDAENKKRKRDALFPEELWRAKNVSNDNLGLRQPVCVTSLTYLAPSSASHHLVAGTELGNVRRYDTRAARRPVADWNVGKTNGIKALKKGMSEHEVFVSDQGCNLFALDLRNGQVIYGYKGLSGAVTSIAPSHSVLATCALDRYVRIHSTFSPPQHAGQQQERKGEVLEKVFMKSIPSVIVWDQAADATSECAAEDDDVWETMETTEVYS